MERLIGGGANPSGFSIREGLVWAWSKDYFSFKPPKINIVYELFEFVTFIVLIALFGLMWLISPFEAGVNVNTGQFMIRFMICFIIYMFCVYKPMLELVKCVSIKTLRQWHSCEHKIINLLKKGLEPTLENLKKVSSLSFTCGSQEYFVKSVSGFMVCLLLILTKVNIFLCLGIGIGIWFILGFISEKTIFLTQYLTRKEPTPEQYKEALRVAKEFLKKYEGSTEMERFWISFVQ